MFVFVFGSVVSRENCGRGGCARRAGRRADRERGGIAQEMLEMSWKV